MKVKLTRKVGNQEAGTEVDVNEKMFVHLTSNGWAEKWEGENDMSKFKLNRNFNGSFAGEVVKVPDHLDGEMVRNRIGEKVTRTDTKPPEKPIELKAEKPPKNKAVQSVPRNKKK